MTHYKARIQCRCGETTTHAGLLGESVEQVRIALCARLLKLDFVAPQQGALICMFCQTKVSVLVSEDEG